MIDTGVSGVVLVPLVGMGENQNELKNHLAELADLSTIPVLLYEWPESKPKYISPEVYIELATNHGVQGIKDTTCTMKDINEKIEGVKDSIVYQANTAFMYEAIESGAEGMMAITTGAFQDIDIEFWKEAKNGNIEKANRLHQLLVFIDTTLGKSYPITAKI